MTTMHPAQKKRGKQKLHKPNEKHEMHGMQGSPIRTDRAVAAYVVDSLDPDPPKGVAAFVKRFWALRRWRRTDECRAALAALDDWTAERPALAPAYEEATRFFIEMCPWGMRMLLGAPRSTEEGVLRAVFFMSEMLLGSGTRHLSPGRLSYRGELTLEAYRRAGEALEASGAFRRPSSTSRFRVFAPASGAVRPRIPKQAILGPGGSGRNEKSGRRCRSCRSCRSGRSGARAPTRPQDRRIRSGQRDKKWIWKKWILSASAALPACRSRSATTYRFPPLWRTTWCFAATAASLQPGRSKGSGLRPLRRGRCIRRPIRSTAI